MPGYGYLDRRINPEGHSDAYGVHHTDRDRGILDIRVGDKSNVVFRASSLQLERSITGLCGSVTYLDACMRGVNPQTAVPTRKLEK